MSRGGRPRHYQERFRGATQRRKKYLRGPCVVCDELTGLLSKTEHVYYCEQHAQEHDVDVVDISLIDTTLSPRQLRVALYAAEGYTVKEIAEKTGSSQAGVKNTLYMARLRLGVPNKRMIYHRLKEIGL